MRYVQYYHKACLTENLLIPACGDRAVVILDARNSIHTSITDSIKFNGDRRPVYPAFQIMEGVSFTQSRPKTAIIRI